MSQEGGAGRRGDFSEGGRIRDGASRIRPLSGEEAAWRDTDAEDEAGAAMAGASAWRWREDDDRRRIRRRRRGRPGPAGSGEVGVVEGEEGERRW